MKKLILAAVLLLTFWACQKTERIEDARDVWNGYSRFLKLGEESHTLWAGQHIDVGTVTYGIDEDANFYVHYDCSASGWLISESHMYAGDKISMPVNMPGQPKVGRFPYSQEHSPWASEYTYSIPLASLPPADDPGFVVAAHCIVHGPDGQQETAWAEGDHVFSDKGWGWYDDFYYDQGTAPSIILYGTLTTVDTGYAIMVIVQEDTAVPIFRESLGNAPTSFDAAAYDEESGMFFFADYENGSLWVNPLLADGPAFCAGSIIGTPRSATFYDGYYYYTDAFDNTIYRVDFSQDWLISSIMALSVIPNAVTVNDIAMSPSGTNLYILGDLADGIGTELITWELANDNYYSMAVASDRGAQIAFGSDGVLYAIATDEGSLITRVYSLDISSGVMVPVSDGVVLDDPVSDIAHGRVL